MKVDCISDLHGDYPDMPGGDTIIIAGDLTASDTLPQYIRFMDWLHRQKYKYKIVIAGNHDGGIQNEGIGTDLSYNFIYLQDSGVEIEGYKFWGSPWTPEFCDWHFMLPRGAALKEKWDLIPNETDVLITHGPPYLILDKTRDNKHVGCAELRSAVDRVKPQLMIFGHVHEGYGEMILKHEASETRCANVAHNDRDYNPVNKSRRFELKPRIPLKNGKNGISEDK